MSGSLDISLKDELLFIESLLIPSFDPDIIVGTSKERKKWMRDEANNTRWDVAISTELIKRFGTVDSLEEAKGERTKVESWLEKAEEKERKQGKSKRHLFIIHRSSPCFVSSCRCFHPEYLHVVDLCWFLLLFNHLLFFLSR